MSKGQEKVLVFQSKLLEPYLSSFYGGFLEDSEILEELCFKVLDPQNQFYIYRDVAEKDESVKQIIPYTVLYNEKYDYFLYQRTKKGGENRLHDKFSVGVGGHINPADGLGGKETFDTALLRELNEEVTIWTSEPTWPWPALRVGAIYDSSEPVSRVHFGVVSMLKMPKAYSLEFHDPALAEGKFLTAGQIKSKLSSLESWSKIVAENLL